MVKPKNLLHKTKVNWKHKTLLVLVSMIPFFFFAAEVFARKRSVDVGTTTDVASNPLLLTVVLGAMSLVPFMLMMMTSFVKIAVVLSMVRTALGTQQNPPTQVIVGLSIILTIYVMVPVGLEIKDATEPLFNSIQGKLNTGKKQDFLSGNTVANLIKAAMAAQVPVKKFLKKHSHAKDRTLFYSLAFQLRPEKYRKGITPDDFTILVPSFVISELKEAFQIGFLIFLPFIVIDMVVANILLALGMHMLSPTTISLPFKLLLFVMIDGWYLIAKGLILGYL